MDEKLLPSRRDFLKIALAAGVAVSCGASINAKILPHFKKINGRIFGVYTVDFSTDEGLSVLKSTGGSVVIDIPGAFGLERKIVLTRVSDDAFIAVSAICTHVGEILEPYNPITKVILCPLHKSEFSIDGKVLKDPAAANLQNFTTFFAGGATVDIEIPGLVGVEDELPNRFSLENFPNPATDQTAISFVLPKETDVVLKIMNTQGQEIATLLDGKLSTGNHSIPFKTSNLASGIYFYQLTANGLAQTKQLTVAQ